MAERPSELNKEIEITNKNKDGETVNEVVNSDDPDQIRENIEETRAEMSETIDAIQEKLSFSNISEQVKTEVSDYVGETLQTAKNTVIDAVIEKGGFIMKYADKRINEIADTDVVKAAKRNPLALGLIGLGVGLLFFGIGNGKKRRSKFRYDEEYDGGKDYSRGFSSKNKKSTIKAAQSKISDAASTVGDSVSSAASVVSDKVSSAAGAISETAGDVADRAYKQVGNLGSKAQDFAGSAQDNYEYYMEENPLAVGAVAMALGAAVGLAFPSTRVENKYMGAARDNLLNKAEETARDAVGKAQKVAGQVTENVKQEAKNQGLT